MMLSSRRGIGHLLRGDVKDAHDKQVTGSAAKTDAGV